MAKELTEKEIKHYGYDVTVDIEHQLDKCGIRCWDIIFDEDYLSRETQRPAFILNDEDYPLGYIDMDGNMELNNDSYGDDEDIACFSPEELMVLGAFGKKLKYGRL